MYKVRAGRYFMAFNDFPQCHTHSLNILPLFFCCMAHIPHCLEMSQTNRWLTLLFYRENEKESEEGRERDGTCSGRCFKWCFPSQRPFSFKRLNITYSVTAITKGIDFFTQTSNHPDSTTLCVFILHFIKPFVCHQVPPRSRTKPQNTHTHTHTHTLHFLPDVHIMQSIAIILALKSKWTRWLIHYVLVEGERSLNGRK